ncbi:dTDP-4-dehydrorhamnose reductase [Erwiniaceae bacterium CAU 1747]
MKILLLGKNGQVGWELQRALSPLGTLTALGSDSTDHCGDFTRPQDLADSVRQLRPDVIVNAAAWTAVDKAESESEPAHQINATAVAMLAKEAHQLGALLVHYSTDYVFPGEGDRPWQESDATGPQNVYGASKLAGEQAIQRYCVKHLIFRTSWVYASRGNNFAKTMLRLAAEREELSIINDQFGAPTGADLIADCTAHAIRTVQHRAEAVGLYHLVASGTTTWFDYARFVFDEARASGIRLTLKNLHAVPTSSYPTPARRPLNSRLATDKFCTTFGLTLPDWQQGVRRMLQELNDTQILR